MNKKRKLLESSEERGDFQERGAAFEGAPVEVLAPVGCSEVIPGPFLPVPPALIEGFRIQDPLFTRASLWRRACAMYLYGGGIVYSTHSVQVRFATHQDATRTHISIAQFSVHVYVGCPSGGTPLHCGVAPRASKLGPAAVCPCRLQHMANILKKPFYFR